MDIDPKATLADLVVEHPELAGLFERLDLDFCCGGARPLAAACEARGLDPDTVVRMLEASTGAAPAPAHAFDARTASTRELCGHIVTAHHEPWRHDLPRLVGTAQTVARVHGGDDPRLVELASTVDALADDLLTHFDREEQSLFPACVELEAGETLAEDHAALDELEDDHADVGETLRLLRGLADDYRPETARCSTHRALLDVLVTLERDLHLHIHEENNVLFPRIRGLSAA